MPYATRYWNRISNPIVNTQCKSQFFNSFKIVVKNIFEYFTNIWNYQRLQNKDNIAENKDNFRAHRHNIETTRESLHVMQRTTSLVEPDFTGDTVTVRIIRRLIWMQRFCSSVPSALCCGINSKCINTRTWTSFYDCCSGFENYSKSIQCAVRFDSRWHCSILLRFGLNTHCSHTLYLKLNPTLWAPQRFMLQVSACLCKLNKRDCFLNASSQIYKIFNTWRYLPLKDYTIQCSQKKFYSFFFSWRLMLESF